MTNLINSVYAIKQVFFGKMGFDIKHLEEALDDNFSHYENTRLQLAALPKFGNDNDDVDSLAKQLVHEIFSMINKLSTPARTYLPFINLFTTYVNEGLSIRATPDGRKNGEPVGDSFGAVQGTDLNGPTALLKSVTTTDQLEALGTPVVNIRFSTKAIVDEEGRKKIKALLMSYFHRGGLQIQVSALDTASMKAAVQNPEKYKSLLVRIGGYSEYFTRLSPALQQEVIKRSEHL